ncbi:MAG: hypothetical protein K8U03_11755 [Planctomycetia bacterium]|nr:hypothetical protein [Planctomycetia bacterium]
MGTKTTSIVRELKFSQVRTHWPVAIEGAGESHSACPLCRKPTWQVYEDPHVAGEWASCSSCRFAGDPLEWTARITCRNIWQTVRALGEAGIIDTDMSSKTIGRYMRDHVGYRRKIAAFWRHALRDLSIRSLEHLTDWQLDVFRDHCQGHERESMGIAGVANAREVEALFHPGSVALQNRLNRDGIRTKRRGSGAGASRIFTGADWGNFTTIAFEDLPGRISGFYFRQPAEEDSAAKSLFHAIPHAPGNHAVREAGLAMLTLSLGSVSPNFRGWAFIVHDAVLAAELQTHALSHCMSALPIFGAYADENCASDEVFRCLAPRQLVFWSPHAANRMACLKQCCRAQGLFVNNLTAEQVEGMRPYDLLVDLRRLAIPWDAALRLELMRLPRVEAAAFLDGLQLPGDVHNRLLQQSREPLLRRLRSVPDTLAGCFRTETEKGTIVEYADGWFDDATKRRELDGQIRVDEILTLADGSELAKGRLRLPDQEVIEFDEPLTKIQKRGLVTVLNEVLKKSGKKKLQAKPKVNALAFAVATAIQPPRLVPQADVVGVRGGTRLHLRKFSIALGGKIEVTEDPFISMDAPAADFDPPRRLTRDALRLLGDQLREQRIFWAMVACIAHNVLATFGGWRPRAIGLIGDGARIVGGEAAGYLGCREVPIAPTCPPARFMKLVTADGARHGWPAFVNTEGMVRWPACREAWLDDTRTKNAIVPLPADETIPRAESDWLLLKTQWYTGDIRSLRPWAPHVLTGYFQDLFARRGDFGPSSNEPIRTILIDMARWFGRAGGDSKIILFAGHLLGHERSTFGLD